ncbi:hypothetical protein [Solidesulfovibrio sp. C21]|uniref:hypothetical protein n=1 Tax=Solidesulfovibrio sp. C21 TaxID=3398613 RepID=UPI0039FD367A
MKSMVILFLLVVVPTVAQAAGRRVTPEMREALTQKLTAQCLQQEAAFAQKGYTRAQTVAICKCAMQQTGALLNSRTVDYILHHGVMPEDMQRKAASATEGCIRSITMHRKP